MSLVCDFIYPYLVQVFNSIILGASTRGRYSLQVHVAAIRMWSFHLDLVGPHALEGVYRYYLA